MAKEVTFAESIVLSAVVIAISWIWTTKIIAASADDDTADGVGFEHPLPEDGEGGDRG